MSSTRSAAGRNITEMEGYRILRKRALALAAAQTPGVTGCRRQLAGIAEMREQCPHLKRDVTFDGPREETES